MPGFGLRKAYSAAVILWKAYSAAVILTGRVSRAGSRSTVKVEPLPG
jgi:hypothetical protein